MQTGDANVGRNTIGETIGENLRRNTGRNSLGEISGEIVGEKGGPPRDTHSAARKRRLDVNAEHTLANDF